MKSVFVLSTLIATTSVQAFAPIMTKAPTATTLFNTPPLNQVDEMCIENVAQFCLQYDHNSAGPDECDVEEFQALVNQLTDQRAYHVSQTALIDDLLQQLQSAAGSANADEEVVKVNLGP